MKRRVRTALGIDVSDGQIRLAVVRRDGNRCTLLKTAGWPVPQGMLNEGGIRDGAALAKAIRDLMARDGIKADEAAVGLYVNPMLMHIIDMPKPMPENLGSFVEKEIKNCVRLASGGICLDYCGIEGRKRLGDKRIFAVAAERTAVVELAQSIGRAGLDLRRIEPVMSSYVRALYENRIAGRPRYGVMLLLLRDGYLTVSVWLNERLDFIRTRPLAPPDAESTGTWLAEQIDAIARYYDAEVPGSTSQWEALVMNDTREELEGLDWEQGWDGVQISVDVLNRGQALAETGLASPGGCDGGIASAAAVGLALGLLTDDRGKTDVNLLPEEVIETKRAKSDALVAANVAAGVLLVLIVAVGAWTLRIDHVKAGIGGLLQESLDTKAGRLVKDHTRVDFQLERAGVKFKRMEEIAGSHTQVNWQSLLKDIGGAAGRDICVTSAASAKGNKLTLRGLAFSSEAVNEFVNALEKSPQIELALLHETQKYEGRDDVVSYEIECVLSEREGDADAE
jgi:Tfp pilus assembly protein PilN